MRKSLELALNPSTLVRGPRAEQVDLSALLRWFFACALTLVLPCAPIPLLAGTTGSLAGTLTDAAGAAIPGVRISVSSPSQTTSSVTDASGSFSFLSLAPDTYTLSAQKTGYDAVSVAGINVFADQTQRLTLKINRTLRTIGTVTSRAADSLVRSGTTADVYSVNAAAASAAKVLGGGGNLNTAYSAIIGTGCVRSH